MAQPCNPQSHRPCLRRAGPLMAALLFGLAVLAAPSACQAEEDKPPATPSATGRIYVQGGYVYNFNRPETVNDYHLFDHKANAITADFFQILVDRATSPDRPVGFRVNLVGGEAARFMHSAGLGDIDTPVDVTEAFLRFRAPLGSGLDIDAGKFMSPCGVESTFAIDNANYSNSFLYNFTGPFTFTGVRAKYAFDDHFNATAYATRGWDAFRDNNSGNTLGLGLGYNPDDRTSFAVTAFAGPEQENEDRNTRLLIDGVATYRPSEDWLLQLNYDYAREQAVPGFGDCTWGGAEGVVRYQFNGVLALALRGEVFDDPQGFRTGIPQCLRSVTLTPEIKLPCDIILRPEIRQDWSDQPAFRDGTRSGQTTMGIGVMYQHSF